MNTKRYALILLFALFCTSANPHAPHAQDDHCDGGFKSDLVLVGLLGALCWITAPDHVKQNLQKQIYPGKLASNFLTEYSSWMLALCAHEAGHALVASHITGQPSTIHIGSTTPDSDPLFTIGNINVNSLDPKHGVTMTDIRDSATIMDKCKALVTEYCAQHKIQPTSITPQQLQEIFQSPEYQALQQQLGPTRAQRAAILLAGGVGGIIGYHLVQALLTKKIRFNHITLHQLMGALLPMTTSNDGAALWRECLGVPEDVIQKFIDYAPYFAIMGEIMVSASNPDNTPNTQPHTIALIGLINFFTRGYLRFHA